MRIDGEEKDGILQVEECTVIKIDVTKVTEQHNDDEHIWPYEYINI